MHQQVDQETNAPQNSWEQRRRNLKVKYTREKAKLKHQQNETWKYMVQFWRYWYNKEPIARCPKGLLHCTFDRLIYPDEKGFENA